MIRPNDAWPNAGYWFRPLLGMLLWRRLKRKLPKNHPFRQGDVCVCNDDGDFCGEFIVGMTSAVTDGHWAREYCVMCGAWSEEV